MNKEELPKETDGITLIALIITIIVMLILVAVTVQIAVNSGLFGHAQDATSGYGDSQAKEQSIGDGKFNIVINGVEYSSLEELKENLVELGTEEKETIINENNIKKANVQDNIALIQTAEGAVAEISNILQRMRELGFTLQQNTNLNETDRESVAMEIQELSEEITHIATNTIFNNTVLLDGTFSKNIAINDDVLTIENCTAEGLNIASSNFAQDLSTEEGITIYNENVESAINTIIKLRSELGVRQNGLENLYTFYENAEQAISNSSINWKNDLAKVELNSIRSILQRNRQIATQGTNGTNTEEDLLSLMLEIKINFKTINTVIET